MREITPEPFYVYKFEELSDEVKEKVYENYRNFNVDNEDWWEGEVNLWTEELARVGFIRADIYFTGFWSQGDGACFDAKIDLDVLSNVMFYKSTSYEEARMWRTINLANYHGYLGEVTIYTINHHYSHKNCRRISVENVYLRSCTVSDEIEKTLMGLEDIRYDLCVQIYRSLREDYEYLTSDEAIKDTIEANDYDFTLNGKIY